MRPRVGREPSDWQGYLARFHHERAGITETILAHSRDDELDPYSWCAAAVAAPAGPTLDIGCGSGPMQARVPGWIGTDPSSAELGDAASRSRRPLARSSAGMMPVVSASVPTVVSTMALQIVDDLDVALHEIARVLQPTGIAVALLPASGPLAWRDVLFYLRLQLALRQRIRYPNDAALRPGPLPTLATRCGLRVTRDERRTFRYPLSGREAVEAFLDSLYLPHVDGPRLARARDVVERRIGGELQVPLRRVVFAAGRVTKPGAP